MPLLNLTSSLETVDNFPQVPQTPMFPESGRHLHEPVALLCRWAAANTALLVKIDATGRKKS